MRIRAAVWGRDLTRGTVFLYPGRCEYVEKYGRTARSVVSEGYAIVSIDWRGQGMADRLLPDGDVGHVGRFADYQRDATALLEMARALDLPEPFYLLAHSMGGCIGLRHLIDGSPFRAASFSAPMWGITIAPALKALAAFLPPLATRLGLGGVQTPTTTKASYILDTPFEGNMLTRDPEMWAYMTRQVREETRFRLGGPSLGWLSEAMNETRALAAAPRPDLRAHTSVGALEKIVSVQAIETIMATWPKGDLTRIPDAEHEILMEKPPVRQAFLERSFATFESASAG